MMTNPDGTLKLCCIQNRKISNKEGESLHLSKSSLADAWNTDFYQDVRIRMLAGEKVAGCESCYEPEKLGKGSYRQGSNSWWYRQHREEVIDLVEGFRAVKEVKSRPQSLDLRLGNQCNLSCRSCAPCNSSRLTEEWQNLRAENQEFKEFWHGESFAWPTPEAKPKNRWHESTALLSEIREQLPHVKLLYLTGGEPMMVKANYDLIEVCLREGHAKNIELMFNTNLTIYSKKFYESLIHFKKVQVNCSVDGFGAVNDYLRFPSKWEDIDQNLRRILATKGNLRVTASIVTQFHNILNLTDLLRYLELINQAESSLAKINLDLSLLQFPDWLQVGVLPETVRIEAGKRLRDFADSSKLYAEDQFWRENIDAALKLLKSETIINGQYLFDKNLRFTRCFDGFRKLKMRNFLPELVIALEKAGTELP